MSWIKDRLKLFTEDGETNINRRSGRTTGNRRSGRTTGNILKAVSEAMLCPEHPIVIVDHYSGRDPRRFTYMGSMLQDILEKLKFEGFYFNKSKGTITYSLDPNYIKSTKKTKYLTIL